MKLYKSNINGFVRPGVSTTAKKILDQIYKLIDDFYYPKKINYIGYWIVIGALYFIGSELILRIFEEPILFYPRLFTSILLAGICIEANFIRRNLKSRLVALGDVIKFPKTDFDFWLSEVDKYAFPIRTRIYKIIFFLICGFAWYAFNVYGFPFDNLFLNILMMAGLAPLIAICTTGAIDLIYLLILLSKIAQFSDEDSFYILKTPGIQKLSNFFSLTSIYILAVYTWFVITIQISPYEIAGIILFCVGLLGFYPFALFLWSFIEIHSLYNNSKQKQVIKANQLTVISLNKSLEAPSIENSEWLALNIKNQKEIDSQNTWPVAFRDVTTFLITFAIPVATISLAIKELLGF